MLSIPRVVVAAVVMVGLAAVGGAVDAQKGAPGVSRYDVPNWQSSASIDFSNAKAMPMPQAPMPAERDLDADFGAAVGAPGFAGGTRGSSAVPAAGQSRWVDGGDSGLAPQEYGTSKHVYTNSRVDLSGYNVSKLYPYRAAGKLYFKIGTGNYVCSASLIKKGLIVTAAHCVTKFGGAWYSSWVFVPAKAGSTTSIAYEPYGRWTGTAAWVMTTYKNGSDPCMAGARGVVCKNDVAVIRLAPKSGKYPGTTTGWFGYGWNGWGFNSSKLALINQLGYPVSHDGGNKMQRTDSEGFVSSTFAGNTIWGSRQTGGSSGGPELVNLGTPAALSGTSYGTYGSYNIVVGVTSWGYTSTAVKQQGASPFLSTNIVPLVKAACTGFGGC